MCGLDINPLSRHGRIPHPSSGRVLKRRGACQRLPALGMRPPSAALLLLTATVVSSNPRYRIVITATVGQDQAALGEFELLDEDGRSLAIRRAINPGGTQKSTERAERVVDGQPSTKWMDHDFFLPAPGLTESTGSILELELASADEAPSGYRLYTANDQPRRDPTSWTFDMRSSADELWHTLHTVNDFVPPWCVRPTNEREHPPCQTRAMPKSRHANIPPCQELPPCRTPASSSIIAHAHPAAVPSGQAQSPQRLLMPPYAPVGPAPARTCRAMAPSGGSRGRLHRRCPSTDLS